MTPNENSKVEDAIQEITQIITSTKNDLQPIEEVINEAMSITQRSSKPNGIKIDVVEHHSRNSAGSRGSGKGSPRATGAAGFKADPTEVVQAKHAIGSSLALAFGPTAGSEKMS